MKFYHGSATKGIKSLAPQANENNNLKEPCIYFTQSKALALVYIWDKPYKWMTFGFNEEGTPVYSESFKGGLEAFYKGVSGVVYEVEEELALSEAVGIQGVAVAYEPVKVSRAIEVKDAYEELLLAEAQGRIIIKRFEDLSEKGKASNRKMILSTIKHFDLLNKNEPMGDFIKSTFSDIWNDALGS